MSLFPTTFLSEENIILLIILPALGGVGLGVLYLTPYSMVPDVIELDELQTGERREGSFFSIFIFCEKLASGLTLAFSNYLLGGLGYEASLGSNQPPPVITAMRILVGVCPCLILLISWIACYFYPISRSSHQDTLKSIEKARKIINAPLPASDDYLVNR